jgi:hypothetical protein
MNRTCRVLLDDFTVRLLTGVRLGQRDRVEPLNPEYCLTHFVSSSLSLTGPAVNYVLQSKEGQTPMESPFSETEDSEERNSFRWSTNWQTMPNEIAPDAFLLLSKIDSLPVGHGTIRMLILYVANEDQVEFGMAEVSRKTGMTLGQITRANQELIGKGFATQFGGPNQITLINSIWEALGYFMPVGGPGHLNSSSLSKIRSQDKENLSSILNNPLKLSSEESSDEDSEQRRLNSNTAQVTHVGPSFRLKPQRREKLSSTKRKSKFHDHPEWAYNKLFELCYMMTTDESRRLLDPVRIARVRATLDKLKHANIGYMEIDEFKANWPSNWRASSGGPHGVYQPPTPERVIEFWDEIVKKPSVGEVKVAEIALGQDNASLDYERLQENMRSLAIGRASK